MKSFCTHWPGTFSLLSARVSIESGGREAQYITVPKAHGCCFFNGCWLFQEGMGRGIKWRWWVVCPTTLNWSLQSRPAAGLRQQCRAQQQQQQQQSRGGRRCQGGRARVGVAAAPQLWLTAALLTQQAGVSSETAAADVVDTHPSVLAAQEFVVTHPSCDWRDSDERNKSH